MSLLQAAPPSEHLDENQFIQAVVDPHDLDPVQQEHLRHCDRCMQSLKRFDEELTALGRLVQRMTPPFQRRVIVPAAGRIRSNSFLPRWPVAVGALVAAALIMIVFYATPWTPQTDQPLFVNWDKSVWHSDPVMVEVKRLSEDALPSSFPQPDGGSTTLSDDFIDFLVPAPDSDELSHSFFPEGPVWRPVEA